MFVFFRAVLGAWARSPYQLIQYRPGNPEWPPLCNAIHTFEGTETMQALIVGRAITGIGAFT